MNLRVAPSARTAHSLLFLSLSARCRAVRFDVCRVDHLRVRRSPAPRQLPEKVLAEPATRPAHEAVVDRRRRAILGRAITPAATALETCMSPLMTIIDRSTPRTSVGKCGSIRAQLLAQPKQIPARDPDPLPKTKQDHIVRPRKLMNSDLVSHSFGRLPRCCVSSGRTDSVGNGIYQGRLVAQID